MWVTKMDAGADLFADSGIHGVDVASTPTNAAQTSR
jgi:hypothetical protein